MIRATILAISHTDSIQGISLSSKPGWRKSTLQPKANPPQKVIDGQKEIAARTPKSRSVEQTCFTDLACPTAHVSAFCRAVIAKVIPHGFWGSDHNRRIITYWIDQFVCLRRFENLNLHQVTQKLQVGGALFLT